MAKRDTLVIKPPSRFVWRMVGFLALVSGIVWLVHEPLVKAVSANPPLNIGIITVLLLGILFTIGQTLNLRPEIKWLNRMADGSRRAPKTPALLSPLARMLGEDGSGLSPAVARSLLDGVGSRLDESREISRYMVGLLIFLGLLGTFWGLLQTVDAVGETIRSLSVGVGAIEDSFEELRLGLEAPLSGMGTAFSSSLIGLAGSLILGFLDIQMAQAQNRFHSDLEEWLAEVTYADGGFGRLQFDADAQVDFGVDGDGARYLAGAIDELSRKLGLLTQHMQTEQQVMLKLAENHARLVPMIERLADPEQISIQNQYTEAIYGHLRNLDETMQAVAEQTATNGGGARDESFWELKKELARLTQTLKSMTQQS